MWCHTCQQDVPAVASPQRDGPVRCVRCGGAVIGGHDETAEAARVDTAPLAAHSASPAPQLILDDWELEEALRAARGFAERFDAAEPANGHAASGPVRQRHRTMERKAPRSRSEQPQRRSTATSTIAWIVLSVGLMLLVCGGVLLAWSVVAQRAELWNLGMPLAIGSQALLVLGLVLQLDSLWQSNRDTSQTLEELDEQLDDLRHATTLLSTSHTSAAQSFYAHLAEGASPQLLLADLKGQLDLLATRMTREP